MFRVFKGLFNVEVIGTQINDIVIYFVISNAKFNSTNHCNMNQSNDNNRLKKRASATFETLYDFATDREFPSQISSPTGM